MTEQCTLTWCYVASLPRFERRTGGLEVHEMGLQVTTLDTKDPSDDSRDAVRLSSCRVSSHRVPRSEVSR